MQRVKLDRIDRRILADLQDDGRMTNVELARRAGISAPPCLRRVRALEDAGYVRGYHADIDPVALGFNVIVFAHVGLNSQADSDLRVVRGTGAGLAGSARMPHAGRRDRLPVEGGRPRLGRLPALPDHPPDRRAQHQPRQERAGDPRRKHQPGVPIDIEAGPEPDFE